MKLKLPLALLMLGLAYNSQAQMPAGYSLGSVPGLLPSSSRSVAAVDGLVAVSPQNIYSYGIHLGYNDTNNIRQATRAMRYNGSTWVTLADGIDTYNYVNDAAATAAGAVYFVGNFSSVYNVPGNPLANTKAIAKWTGTTWQSVGQGVNSGSIAAIAVKGENQVFVGGSQPVLKYNNLTIDVDHIGYWNGSAWSTVGSGLDGEVRALAYNAATDTIYAAGFFNQSYGYQNFSSKTLNGIGKWSPSTGWQALGNGIDTVRNIVVSDDGKTVFASGIGSGAYAKGSTYNYISGTEEIAYYTQAKGWQGLGRAGLDFTVVDTGAIALLPDQTRLVVRLLDTDGYAHIAVWSMDTKKWQVLYTADYSNDPYLGTDRAISIAGDSIYVGDRVATVTAGSQSYTINAMAKITVADIDGDGYESAQDNCPGEPNPDQADSDGDGIGDVCDDDIDNDGVPNAQDRAPYDPNYTTTKPVASNFFGQAKSEKFGTRIHAARDLNGDGLDDYVVAAPLATVIDANGRKLAKAGRVDVFSGFNDQLLFSIEGQYKGEQLGHAITSGDLDGIWPFDLAISSLTADKKAGKVTVIKNADLNSRIEFKGVKGEQLGFALAIGNVTGDSKNDLVISSIMANKKMGRVYILENSKINTGDLSNAIVIEGHAKGEYGYSLAVQSSANKLLVGSPLADTQSYKKAGKVYMYGTPISSTASQDGANSINGSQVGERFGHAIAVKYSSWATAISAPFYKEEKMAKTGRVQTFNIDTNSFTIYPQYNYIGQNKGEQFGWSLASGIDDFFAGLLIGSPFAPSADTKPLKKAGRVDMYPNWTNATGVKPIYGNKANLQLGASMAAVDVTGDWVADILCGAPTAAHGKLKNVGQVLFFDGASL